MALFVTGSMRAFVSTGVSTEEPTGTGSLLGPLSRLIPVVEPSMCSIDDEIGLHETILYNV